MTVRPVLPPAKQTQWIQISSSEGVYDPRTPVTDRLRAEQIGSTETIVDLLDEQLPESLATMETFIRFVHTQGRPVVTTAEPAHRFR